MSLTQRNMSQPALANGLRQLGVMGDIQQRASSLNSSVNGRLPPDPLLLESERLLEVCNGGSHIGRTNYRYRRTEIIDSHCSTHAHAASLTFAHGRRFCLLQRLTLALKFIGYLVRIIQKMLG